MAVLVSTSQYGRARLFEWALTNVDTTGDAGINPGAPDRSLHVTGTFDTATLVLEGTNDPLQAAWAVLHDTEGNAISLTDVALTQVMENTLYLRPRVIGGGGSTLIYVKILSRSS